MRNRTLLPLIAGLLSTPAWSAGPEASSGISEDAFFSEMPVVLSVARLAQPLRDAPGAVTVIDAEMIRKSGARDLADLLRMVPGFLVAQSFNGAPHAVYHGMTEENPRGLQILVDGRSQYSPLFFGGVAWNLIDISLDDIDRIEVVRGSNSAAYGSNAFLGVVDIRTRSAHETQGVSVRAGNGDSAIQDRYARVGLRVGSAALRLSAERARDTGVDGENDSRRTSRANLHADVTLDAHNELELTGGVIDLELGAGEAGDDLNPLRTQNAKKSFAGLAWRHNIDAGHNLLVRYVHSRETYDDAFTVFALGQFVPIDYATTTRRDEFEAQHTFMPGDASRMVWGVGWRSDRVRARQFYNTDDAVEQNVARLFGNLEWRPHPQVVTNLGATWENDSLSDTTLAPRAMASFHVTPQQTLRVGLSRAHRTPSLTETRSREYYGGLDTGLFGLPYGVRPLEIDRDASGGLQKEMIESQEIGYLGDFRQYGVMLDVRAFKEWVKDRIVQVDLRLTPPNCDIAGIAEDFPTGCGSYKDYLNGQDLRISGVEYQLRWQPRSGTTLTVNQAFVDIASVANARLQTASQGQGAARDAVRHMDNSAPEIASMLRWEQVLPLGLEGSITYYRYGRFQWTKNTSVGAFHRTDWRIAYPFRWGGGRGDVALTVQGDGARHAEYRLAGADPNDPSPAPPQYLSPRAWLALRLEI